MADIKYIYAKEFILGRIDSVKNLIKVDVYMSFLPLTVLIEIIGKINNTNCKKWNCESPGYNFNLGIDCLPEYYQEHKNLLYKSLRCGFAHSLLPQKGIDITHMQEAIEQGNEHLKVKNNGDLVIVAEKLMEDIENRLNIDLAKPYDVDNKMSKPILWVPAT